MKRSHLLLGTTCAVALSSEQNQNRNTGAHEMYILQVAKVLFILSAIAWPPSSPATTFNYNVDVELALSQFDTDNWWLQGYVLPSPTQVDIGDTVVINVNFTNGLVQFDDIGSVLEFGSFSLNSPAGTSKAVSSQLSGI